MTPPRATGTDLRGERMAKLMDREVAPIWHDRFSRLMTRSVPIRPNAFVLEVDGRSGRTTSELLSRLDDSARVLSLVSDESLMNLAKTRVRPEWKKRVYFKRGDFDQVLGMNAETYDLVVANLVLGSSVPDYKAAISELMRVTKAGGQIHFTLALRGSWAEAEDLFEETLRDEGMSEQVGVLRRVQKIRPTAGLLRRVLNELGLSPEDYVIEKKRFELLFSSGREFLFAPVVEHGPLPLWKAILGKGKDPKRTFWRFMNAIDTYYAGHVLSASVVAGVVRIQAPGGPKRVGPMHQFWADYPEIDAVWGGTARARMVAGSSSTALQLSLGDEDELDMDIDVDVDIDIDIDVGGESHAGQDDDEFDDDAAAIPSAIAQEDDENESFEPEVAAAIDDLLADNESAPLDTMSRELDEIDEALLGDRSTDQDDDEPGATAQADAGFDDDAEFEDDEAETTEFLDADEDADDNDSADAAAVDELHDDSMLDEFDEFEELDAEELDAEELEVLEDDESESKA